jgi:hypothetical protein
LPIVAVVGLRFEDTFKQDEHCLELYKKHNIVPETKSRKGWARLFANKGKLEARGLLECVKDGKTKLFLKNCVDEYLKEKEYKYNQNLGEKL